MNFNLPGGVLLLAKGQGKNDNDVHSTGDTIAVNTSQGSSKWGGGGVKQALRLCFPFSKEQLIAEDKR